MINAMGVRGVTYAQAMDSKAEQVRAVGQIVAGLSLLTVLVWAVVEAVSADPAVAGSIIGSIMTAAIGVFAVVFVQFRAEQERLREVQRQRMEPVYKEFVERAHKQFASKDRPNNAEAMGAFANLKGREFLLGAPADVVQALVAFEMTEQSDDEPFAPALAYEELIRSIRRDLGHDDSALQKGHLLRLFSDYR